MSNTPTPDLPVPPAAPVTSIAVDPAAREVAVQAAIDQTKAEAAVAALDAASQPEVAPPALEPSHGVVRAPAPTVDPEPEEPVDPEPEELGEVAPPVASPCGQDEDAPLPTVPEFRALQAKVLELEEHIEELVSHLAQSFGGEYAVKKARMGV